MSTTWTQIHWSLIPEGLSEFNQLMEALITLGWCKRIGTEDGKSTALAHLCLAIPLNSPECHAEQKEQETPRG